MKRVKFNNDNIIDINSLKGVQSIPIICTISDSGTCSNDRYILVRTHDYKYNWFEVTCKMYSLNLLNNNFESVYDAVKFMKKSFPDSFYEVFDTYKDMFLELSKRTNC